MGDKPMMASEAIKARLDVAIVPTSLLGYFKAIPWPELAACLACVYTLCRIYELLAKWWRRRK